MIGLHIRSYYRYQTKITSSEFPKINSKKGLKCSQPPSYLAKTKTFQQIMIMMKVYDDDPASSSVHHQFVISSSSVRHQFIISSSSAHYQLIISSLSIHHKFIIICGSVHILMMKVYDDPASSSVHHQFIISSSLVNHQFIINSL